MLSYLQLLVIVLVWFIFAWVFCRAVQRGKFADRQSQLSWLQLYLCFLTFTLQGEVAEARFDTLFGGLPIALYIKYFSMTLWFYLFSRVLKQVGYRAWGQRLFNLVIPLSVIIGTFSMPLVMSAPSAIRIELRMLVVGLRDLMLLTLVVGVFIPGLLYLQRQERTTSLRLKQLALALCFGLYTLLAFGNGIKAVLILFQFQNYTQVEQFFRPILYACLVCVLIFLIPYRWLFLSFYPGRFMTYLKLKRLEYQVVHHTGVKPLTPNSRLMLFKSGELEFAIYRTVIYLLDIMPLLRKSPMDRTLYDQLKEASHEEASYAELVKALAKVRL